MGERAPHENAFVYIDNSGKLVYVEPEDEGNEADEGGSGGSGSDVQDTGEEKQQGAGDTEVSARGSYPFDGMGAKVDLTWTVLMKLKLLGCKHTFV